MSELIQIGGLSTSDKATRAEARPAGAVFWLQGITLVWMLLECGGALYAAVLAHSVAMAAFGSDSLVELMSAGVVLLQFVPRIAISERSAARAAGVLLFVLALVVGILAAVSLWMGVRPRTSWMGMGVTLAALIIMPILAALKRREARRSNNAALAADAVQSVTCAYLAAIVLVGLAVNAVFRAGWFDAAAALLAIPLLVKEGWGAWNGKSCGCC
jgi:divalent metal cation (Fe/Co/Zn/Cd) transporter